MDLHDRNRLVAITESGNSEATYTLFVEIGTRSKKEPTPTSDEYYATVQWLLKAGELNNSKASLYWLSAMSKDT